jgi:anhydro-N-acetylmuramic acid kinase
VTQTWPVLTALGLMSGTSMDGIDMALLRTDGVHIHEWGLWTTVPYAPALRRQLADIVRLGHDAPEQQVKTVEWMLTEAHGNAVMQFFDSQRIWAHSVDVVGFHGHTVWHLPDKHQTRQIGDGVGLARGLGIDVVYDFRSADIAAGGQGAPLVPVYHQALTAALPKPLAILNLGGVGNITYLGAHEADMLAFDTGPGNALLDDWALRHTGKFYDADGALAAAGQADAAIVARLLDDAYFLQRPPKSLDRNAFSLDAVAHLSPQDGAATLAAFTVESVVRALDHLPAKPERWLVAGGGRLNPVIMQGLVARIAAPVVPVEQIGWQGDAIEAQAFAYLAVRHLRGLPLSYPLTTGVKVPTLGGRLALAGIRQSRRFPLPPE